MKSFLKLIISIIVILISVFTVYFLLMSMSSYNINTISGDKLNNNKEFGGNIQENIISSGDYNQNADKLGEVNQADAGEENANNEMQNGEIIYEISSGEQIEINVSGEKNIEESINEYSEIEKNQIINKANIIESQNNSANVEKTLEDSLGLDIMGIENRDLFETFNITEMSVTVQVAGSMVYILPASDFVNNAQYHYDEHGNLLLYICELMGVGGEIRYYFENNNLVTIEPKVEEDIILNYEESNGILSRAKLIYDKYIK